ncbi:MAG: LLM class flavin-dependent oxidoreductase [Alphaproteobacteria bacterium]|nr:LLM class flavin-dependent oxidoreductase [Alphaproteobacteria bacterium]
MRLGMFMMPVHPPGRSLSDTLAEDTTKAILCDRLGYDELWMGEHFSATTEPFPSPLMFLAGLVPQTKNIALGTAVINLPNHHPAIVAAEAAQFDHMSGGRFMFGVGSGGLAPDFELFDVFDGAVRQRKFLESIDLILKIWAQDPPYDLQGEFWNIRIKKAIVPELGFGGMPKPLQQPHPPVHVSIGSPDSPTARIAAQRGWGIISGPTAPAWSIASQWKTYAEACAAAGKPADGGNWRVSRCVLVAPSDSEAQDRVYGERTANRHYFSYMRQALFLARRLYMIKPDKSMSDEVCTPDAIMDECVIHGSPRTVIDKLVAYRERVGPFGTLLQIGIDWSGPNQAWEREGMRLLAEEVMPKLRQHTAAQAAE